MGSAKPSHRSFRLGPVHTNPIPNQTPISINGLGSIELEVLEVKLNAMQQIL